jgi:hypothetical protein
MGKTKPMLPAAATLTTPIAGLLGRFSSFPVSRGHVTMLPTCNACADDKLRRLDIELRRFGEAALGYPAGDGPAQVFDPE